MVRAPVVTLVVAMGEPYGRSRAAVSLYQAVAQAEQGSAYGDLSKRPSLSLARPFRGRHRLTDS